MTGEDKFKRNVPLGMVIAKSIFYLLLKRQDRNQEKKKHETELKKKYKCQQFNSRPKISFVKD